MEKQVCVKRVRVKAGWCKSGFLQKVLGVKLAGVKVGLRRSWACVRLQRKNRSGRCLWKVLGTKQKRQVRTYFCL